MKKYRSLFVLAILINPLVSEAARSTTPTWWFNLGVGTGTNFGNSQVSLSNLTSTELSLNGTLSDHSLLTFYRAGFSKGLGRNNVKHQGDMGVMYGYVNRKPFSYWSASAGLCYYEVTKEVTDYFSYYYFDTHKNKFKGVGIPLEIQTFWTPFNHFGIGLVGHTVASKYPSIAGMLAIQVF